MIRFSLLPLLLLALSASAAEIKAPAKITDRDPLVVTIDVPADTDNVLNIVEWDLGSLKAHFHDNDREACLWPPSPGEYKISALIITLTKDPFSYKKVRVGAIVTVEDPNPDPPSPGPGPAPVPGPSTPFKQQIVQAIQKVPAASRGSGKDLAKIYRSLVAEVKATSNQWDAAGLFNERKLRVTSQLAPTVLSAWAPYFPEEAKAFVSLGITAGDLDKGCTALIDAATVLETAQ